MLLRFRWNVNKPQPMCSRVFSQGIAARQRSRYLRYLARPPQEKQLIEARKNMIRQKKTWGVFKEGTGTVAVLILLAVIAFGKNTNTEYNLNNALRTAFTEYVPWTQIIN